MVSAVITFFDHHNSRPADGGLPWFTGMATGLLVLQAGLLAALLTLTTSIAASTLRRSRDDPPVASPTSWPAAGLGTPVLTMVAWIFAGGLGAGLVLRAAAFLGNPVASGNHTGQAAEAMAVPVVYFWVATFAVVLLAAAACVLLYLIV